MSKALADQKQMHLPESHRCYGCERCHGISAWNFNFLGCYHFPYKGKWIAEIKNCPKELINITAKFIGKDGSMGFRNGKTYDLWMMKKQNFIYISRRNMNATAIPYETLRVVEKNWELLDIN